MTSPIWTTYWHRQGAPLCLCIYLPAAAPLAAAWMLRHDDGLSFVLSALGLLMLVLAASFHHLTVADEGDRLSVAFGPVPLFQRRVPYDEIRHVEIGRTSILDGWGIHMSPKGGWVWNIWGRDCVVLRLRKGILRIGTDDAQNLAMFLKGRMEDSAE